MEGKSMNTANGKQIKFSTISIYLHMYTNYMCGNKIYTNGHIYENIPSRTTTDG